MLIHSAIATGVLFAFAGLLVYAAVEDVRRLIIPNTLSAAVGALFPAYALSAAGPVDWLGALAVGAGALAVGFLLFARGFIGGGDAKLLAATALWAGPPLLLTFLLVTSMAGGAVALAMLAYYRLRRRVVASGDAALERPAAKFELPYGVAIAVGGLQIARTLMIGG